MATLCSHIWSGIHHVDEAGLELIKIYLPLPQLVEIKGLCYHSGQVLNYILSSLSGRVFVVVVLFTLLCFLRQSNYVCVLVLSSWLNDEADPESCCLFPSCWDYRLVPPRLSSREFNI